MREFSEKKFGELLRRTMLAGVFACAALMLGGGLMSAALPGAGEGVLKAGLLVLLLTPPARLAMMVYGYWRGGEYFFSAASLAVLLMLAVSAMV